MRNLRKISLVLLLLGVFSAAEAQTLDYTTVNYPTSVCNVFNTSTLKVVNGRTHYPVSGGVSYQNTSTVKALVLNTQGGNTIGSTYGTAFAIAYPFKQGYSYSITINAAKQSADPVSAPIFEVAAISSLPDPNVSYPASCGAVDQNKWSGLQGSKIDFNNK